MARIHFSNLHPTRMLKILVPVDLTDNNYKTIHYVLSLSNAVPEARILLIHCFQDYLAEANNSDFTLPSEQTASEAITEQVLNRNEAEAEELLDELYNYVKSINKKQHTHIERVLMFGMPEDLIPEEAERFKPDLIVMGTKGEASLSRNFFGTITTSIAKKAEVPVLTIPETYTGTNISRVLYATDFDKTDAMALHKLQQLLQPYNPAIVCAHVADDDSPANHQKLETLQQQLQQKATGNLRYILLQSNDVATALQTFVIDQHIDLLALTTRSRSLLENLFHPSLAKKLVLDSQVPLLIFHSSHD
jgi:nucleotide-binding universal stress UspA family protein